MIVPVFCAQICNGFPCTKTSQTEHSVLLFLLLNCSTSDLVGSGSREPAAEEVAAMRGSCIIGHAPHKTPVEPPPSQTISQVAVMDAEQLGEPP